MRLWQVHETEVIGGLQLAVANCYFLISAKEGRYRSEVAYSEYS